MRSPELAAYQRQYYWKNRDKIRARRKERYRGRKYGGRRELLARHKMTLETYNAMLESQNGVCAVCNTVPSNGDCLCVDHCHSSGKIRGLLCRYCNVMVGMIEQQERHGKCLKYLERNQQRVV